MSPISVTSISAPINQLLSFPFGQWDTITLRHVKAWIPVTLYVCSFRDSPDRLDIFNRQLKLCAAHILFKACDVARARDGDN